MLSNYTVYKELVYAVVDRAIITRNIQAAIAELLSFETYTRTEILDFAGVDINAYTTECVNLYITLLERMLQSVEYQFHRAMEKLENPIALSKVTI